MTKDDINLNESLVQSNEYENSIIFSPNCVQIPNNLCDYWMSRLTPAEFKVIICLYRKCFAWYEVQKKISLSQIQEMTGLSRKGIIENIKSLVNYGLIGKKQFGSENEIVNYEVCCVSLENKK